MNRRALAAVLLGLALATGGCGGLPSSGPVREGLSVGSPPVEPVRVLPDGPAAGATQEQIVRGFLRAAAGFDDDHAVGRSFLLPNVAQSWVPDHGVTVFPGESSLSVRTLPGDRVRVTVPATASIDESGRYRELPNGSTASATFGLQQAGGQWRIASTPAGFGLWLSAADLDRLYRPFAIHYAVPATRTLVPDERWFPLTPGLATTLARAQLGPVPDYLRDAAVSGVPESTQLAVDAVPVENGRAAVDLSVSGLVADPELRRAMWAQFVATLTQAPTVSSVSLLVGGSKVDLQGVPEAPSSLVQVGYPEDSDDTPVSSVVVRQGTALHRLDPGRLGGTEDPRRAPASLTGELPAIPLTYGPLALSRDGAELAAVSTDGTNLARWRGTRLTPVAPFARDLTRPAFDGRHGLWVGGTSDGTSHVYVIDTSTSPAPPHALDVPWLGNRRVVALRVAADSTRMVLATRGPGGDVRVDVVGIVRAANGAPRSLTTPLRVGERLTIARDVAWVDSRTVAVLGSAGSADPLRPYLVEVGGPTTALAPVAGAVSLTSTGGPRGLVVANDRGQVLTRAGNGWVVENSANDLVVPAG